MRNVLITVDEVIFHAPTKNNPDARIIEQAIIVAEERLIRPTLGNTFYQALIDEKNKIIDAGNKVAQQALVDASLPASAQAVVLKEGDVVNALEYLTPDNLALWKQHLWKLTAECVMLLAFPDSFVQFAGEGTVHAQPQSSPMGGAGVVTPDLRSIKWVMDKKMMDRIDPLRESLHLWLCTKQKADTTKYSLYTKTCDCDADGVAYKRKTDFVLGIYDDEDNNRSCCD
jgi:hypothetical protein